MMGDLLSHLGLLRLIPEGSSAHSSNPISPRLLLINKSERRRFLLSSKPIQKNGLLGRTLYAFVLCLGCQFFAF